ncbi:hypothetical protein D3C77_221790 [compost metagenome]
MGNDRIGTGADILGCTKHVGTAIGLDRHPRLGGSAEGIPVALGHTVTDDFMAIAHAANVSLTCGPAKTLSALLQRFSQMIARPGQVVLLIVFGVVELSERQGIDLAFLGQFIDGRFKGKQAGGGARCAHRGGSTAVDLDDAMADFNIGTGIKAGAHATAILDIFVTKACGIERLMSQRHQLALGIRRQAHALARLRTVPNGGEHLRPWHHQLDRAPNFFRSGARGDTVRPNPQFAAKA